MKGFLLAIETSVDVCGIALTRDGQLLIEHTFRHGMHLSERLMGEVDDVLNSAGIVLHEVEAFAVGIGPGSFTGTRIGVMTVKTFAAVLARPVYGINGLEALAAGYAGVQETIVAPILPCRKGVVFTCPYTVAGEVPVAHAEPAALSLTELSELLIGLAPHAVLFCGAAAGRYREELEGLLAGKVAAVGFGSREFPVAADVARLADLRREQGIPPEEAMTLVPLYISPPPITMPKTPIPTSLSSESKLRAP